MKKVLILSFISVLIICVISGCSKNKDIVGDPELKPTEPIKAEDLIPADNFLGTYKNDTYTMEVKKGEDGQFNVFINSAIENRTSYEWEINAFFSNDTYRLNYTDAVKTVVTYDKNNKELKRTTEYDNGVGRLQFFDDTSLRWENEIDNISNNEFKK